jgi:hypothetical protein
VRIFLGEPTGAIECFERAMRLSPLDPFANITYSGMGAAYLFAGHYDQAAFLGEKGEPQAAVCCVVEYSGDCLCSVG